MEDAQPEVDPISQNGEKIESSLVTSLRNAILDLDTEAVENLLREAPYLVNLFLTKKQDRTVLHELITKYTSDPIKGDSYSAKFCEILGSILRNGGEINQTDWDGISILHLVCLKGGFPKTIEALLTAGVDGNIQNTALQTALHIAVTNGNARDVEALVNGGVDLNIFDGHRNAAIHIAITRPRPSRIIAALAFYRSALNLRLKCVSKLGPTPLHLAAKRGKVEAARALLENGADPHLVDSSGLTPLHLAVVHDLTGKITALLVKNGAKLDCKDGVQGDTPLHKAVHHEAHESLRVLVESRANVNQVNSYGESSIHVAAVRCRDVHTWNLLLTAGGNCTSPNSSGKSAFEKAQRYRNVAAVSMMRQYFPDIGQNNT